MKFVACQKQWRFECVGFRGINRFGGHVMALSSQLSCQTNAVGLRDREPDGICLYHRFRISNTNQWLALIARWRSSLRYAIQHTTVKAPSMQLVKLPSSQLISRMAGLDPSACCLCRLEHEGQSKRLRAKGQRRTSRQYGRFDRCWWSALDIASVASKLCSWTPGSLSRGALFQLLQLCNTVFPISITSA